MDAVDFAPMTAASPASREKQLNTDDLLAAALDGRALTAGEVVHLLTLQSAGEQEALREAVAGENTPMPPWRREVPLFFSNVCELRAPVYAFPATPEDLRAYVYSVDDLDERLEAGREMGAERVLLSARFRSGLRVPGLEHVETLRTYAALVSYVREKCPALEIHGFSPDEIEFLHVLSGRSHRYVLEMLMDAGLNRLSGAGSEPLSDPVRRALSPKLLSVRAWLEIAELAAKLSLAPGLWTVFGHLDTPADRAAHLLEWRRLLERHEGGISEIILQPAPPPPPGKASARALSGQALAFQGAPTQAETLRMLAVTRLILQQAANRGSALALLASLAPEEMHEGLEGSLSVLNERHAEALRWGATHPGGTGAAAFAYFLKFARDLPLPALREFRPDASPPAQS